MPPRRASRSAGSYRVEVEGLAEFRRDLRAVEAKYPKELAKINREVAKEVKDGAQRSARSQGSVAGKSAPSLRHGASGTRAYVQIDGAKHPYALGAEFGSLRYAQFKPWRGNQFTGWDGGPGYFLHPTIREMGGDIEERYLSRLDDLHRQAFPD